VRQLCVIEPTHGPSPVGAGNSGFGGGRVGPVGTGGKAAVAVKAQNGPGERRDERRTLKQTSD
jgi:hypothetical protein